MKKSNFKTYEEHCVEKIRAIQPATRAEIARALGYQNANQIYHVIIRMEQQNLLFCITPELKRGKQYIVMEDKEEWQKNHQPQKKELLAS